MEKPELELILSVSKKRYEVLSKILQLEVKEIEEKYFGKEIFNETIESEKSLFEEFDEIVEKLSVQFERTKYCEAELEKLKWEEEE